MYNEHLEFQNSPKIADNDHYGYLYNYSRKLNCMPHNERTLCTANIKKTLNNRRLDEDDSWWTKLWHNIGCWFKDTCDEDEAN